MKVREMQIEFERIIQQINPLYASALKPDTDTIMFYLNAAQDRLVRAYYTASGSNIDNELQLGRVSTILSKLITNTTIQNVVPIKGKEVDFTLPKDFMLYLTSHVSITGTYLNKRGNVSSQTKLINSKDIDLVSGSYMDSPIIRMPYVALIGSDTESKLHMLKCIVDKHTSVVDITIHYLHKPTELKIQNVFTSTDEAACDLAETAHKELVETAVNMFINEGVARLQQKQKSKNESAE